MIRLEQLARAVGALAAGFTIAFEYLRAPVEPEALLEPVGACCPICGRPLGDAPHVHEQDVIWPCEETGVCLLTTRDGGNLLVIPDPEAGA